MVTPGVGAAAAKPASGGTVDADIRAATTADLGSLVELLVELFSIEADFSPDRARQRRGLELMLTDPERRRVLVAEREGAVVGMVTGQLLVSTAEGGPSLLVEDMIVRRPERGRGLGRRLLAAIQDWAVERGATRAQLLADAQNTPALDFYRRLGWRRTQLVCLRLPGLRSATRGSARPAP
jgi:GNAT superfamily N-acetyltransferase